MDNKRRTFSMTRSIRASPTILSTSYDPSVGLDGITEEKQTISLKKQIM